MAADVQLPNGMRVACLQKHEVLLVNLEIESYFSNGIEVKPGDTIFDVGANIGLFSLAACERCNFNLQAYAFEPVKELFNLLHRNIERNAGLARVEALPFGLSIEAKPVKFAYYPRAPVLCTAYPDEAADIEVMKEAILNSIMYLDEAPLPVQCLRWLPEGPRRAVVQFALKQTLRPRTITCNMETLSRFVRDREIQRIDYLKIDVEKAELDVLSGIAAEDWGKIRQVVVEVHEIEDRLRTVTSLLTQKGLDNIVVCQPPTLHQSNIHSVFAMRTNKSR